MPARSNLWSPFVKADDRVLVICCDDPWVHIRPGTCGTVRFVDDCGTVFVDWDDGTVLGMNEGFGDRWVVVDPRMTCSFESRGHSECLLPQGHTGDPDPEKRLHSDLTLLWRDDGQLCNLGGQPLSYSGPLTAGGIPAGCVCEWENLLAGWKISRLRADCPVHGELA